MYNSVLGDKLVLTVEKESESLCDVKVISWEEGHVWVIRSHRLFSLVEENDDACGFACCFQSTPAAPLMNPGPLDRSTRICTKHYSLLCFKPRSLQ